jgi:hypothetical protein
VSLQADAARLRAGTGRVVHRVQHDLAGYFGSLDFSRPEAARDGLLAVVPRLVARYGDVAATVAADWYEQTRAAQLAARYGTFRTVLAAGIAAEAVESTVRYAAGHLFTDDPGQALLLLNGAVQRQTLQTARTTILDNAARDPARPVWQRVASGPKTCDFCAMLIGRGAVYATRATAGGDGNDYHDHCDCQPVVSWTARR